MAEDVWGVSTQIVTGIFTLASAIIGAIIGSMLTLVGARFLRRRGKVQSFIIAWLRVGEEPARERRVFEIRLHNEKDVSTTLWRLRFVFHKEGEAWLKRRPREAGTDEPIEVLDLPPWVTVTKKLAIGFDKPRGGIPGDELKKVKESDKIEFIADIPGKGEDTFKAGLPLWDKGRTH